MYYLYHKDTLEVEVIRDSQEEYQNIFMGICSSNNRSYTKVVLTQEVHRVREWFMDIETIKPLRVINV